MFSDDMYKLGAKRSVIRETFEYGRKRAAEIGAENVFDFSLGNPNVPAPANVSAAIQQLTLNTPPEQLHGYTSAAGDMGVRSAIASSINKRFSAGIKPENIYMTCGAAASLTISLSALCRPQDGDEFIVFAPYFAEYKVFIEAAGGKVQVVPPTEPDFQIDFIALEKSVNAKTKALIINSPNNPSGAVYSKETINRLSALLRARCAEYGHAIYLIADEPYREIVYGGVTVPYVMNYYEHSLVCYSYSKSLSLPGERIGYIAVNPKAECSNELYLAICGAGRALGYVCAPAMFQKVIGLCEGCTSDISVYKTNSELLYNTLTGYGYTCVKPQGAFYLFVKSPEPDANSFCLRARKHELLFVPGDDFGCKGYVRIAYCVKTEQILRALPKFEALIKEYQHG